jgi:hypothetical protein
LLDGADFIELTLPAVFACWRRAVAVVAAGAVCAPVPLWSPLLSAQSA